MKKIILLSMLAISAMLAFGFSQQNDGDTLIGVWEPSSGKARVKIEKIGNKYFGKIVWLREPNDPVTKQPKVDKNNPDATMQNVPLKGYRMLKDFVFKGNGEWTDGTIYDPENGSTYSSVIKMKDANSVEIRGYVGVKALGRTDVWKRLQK